MSLDQADNYRNIPRPIVAVAKEFPSGHLIALHQHSRSQFLYASSGVMTVMLDQISSVNMASLELPIPEDQRLKKIYDLLSVNPGDNRTLDDWVKTVGAAD